MPKKKIKKKVQRKVATKKVKKPKEPKTGKYLKVDYESFCELSLLFFSEELMKKGYVERVERSPSYVLAEPFTTIYKEKLKRSEKEVSQTLQHGVTYTPDYDIYFNESAVGIFIWVMGSTTKYDKKLLIAQKVGNLYRVCCEVKPDFSRNSTTPKSVQSMKWLFQRHGIFVNLFRPNDIFSKLFTPDKYLITESGGVRRLKFTPISIDAYLRKK